MNKILLYGNGLNIQFIPDFCFQNFIETLTDEKKLLNLIDEILLKPEYKEFKEFKHIFLELFNKCKNSLLELDKEAKENGVETAIQEFKNSADVLIRQFKPELKNKFYKRFEDFFDLLFFYYLNKLIEINEIKLIENLNWTNKLKKYLNNYSWLYTLNYDNLLARTKIYNEILIYHVHGKLKIKNNKLDYTECILESYQNPKKISSMVTDLPIFVDMNNFKNKFHLDIIGINPANDENIFIFFILSQVCKEINFYYFNANDLKNMIKIIKTINSWNNNSERLILKKDKNFIKLDFNQIIYNQHKKIELINDETSLGYIFKFKRKLPTYHYDNFETEHTLKISLKPVSEFWSLCGIEEKQKINKVTQPEINQILKRFNLHAKNPLEKKEHL